MRIIALALACLLAGCISEQYLSFTSGESDLIGVSLPAQQEVQISTVSHLNGIALAVRDQSRVKLSFSQRSTNSYFGIVSTSDVKSGQLELDPPEGAADEQQ